MTDVLPAVPTAESTSTSFLARLKFDWRLFALLWVMNILASLIAVPYMQAFAEGTSPLPPDVPPVVMFMTLLMIQLACGVFWNGPAIAVGMLAARSLGLGAPMLRALVHREPLPSGTWRVLGIAFVIGLVAGVAVIGLGLLLDPLVSEEMARLGVELPEDATPPPWAGFLGSISAGITEESLLRLFTLSSLAWIGSRVWRGPDGRAPLACCGCQRDRHAGVRRPALLRRLGDHAADSAGDGLCAGAEWPARPAVRLAVLALRLGKRDDGPLLDRHHPASSARSPPV
jgi:hypothetical protein